MKKLIPISLFSVLYFVIASINIYNPIKNPFIQVFDTLYVQQHEVTVSEYSRHASKTEAERIGSSLVLSEEGCLDIVPGASWKKADGKRSSRSDDPVTHLTIPEMQDYCSSLNARLMTLKEFYLIYHPNDEGNVWEGLVPIRNTKDDGYEGVAPVMTYNPNKHGLYDLKGNVCEAVQNNEEFYIAGRSYAGYRYPRLILKQTTLSNVGFRCVMNKQTFCNGRN